MSRKQRTVAVFAVTIQIPLGSNCANTQQYIREGITSYLKMGCTPASSETWQNSADNLTVALTKKVTTYGNN